MTMPTIELPELSRRNTEAFVAVKGCSVEQFVAGDIESIWKAVLGNESENRAA